jgi:23S rRNA (cytosine1962-C5)-methyltransferase
MPQERNAPVDQSTRTLVVRLTTDELPRGPWIYARQVAEASDVEDGALVEVHDVSGRFVGHGLFNSASDIRLRMLSRGRRTDLARPRDFLLRRIKNADDLRRRTLRLHEVSSAYRIVHGEGDDLPGLVIDRLANVLVCEHHALGFWRLAGDVEWALGQLYPGLEVVHRVPSSAVRAEHIDDAPAVPGIEVEIEEHGLRFPVLAAAGHKTGWFCDQRDNRRAVARLARGRDVLDLCCNAGGFALHAAHQGARSVQAVDLDEKVLARARAAASLNGLQVDFTHADAYDHLRAVVAGSKHPGLIVVDPHKMIPNRRELEAGMRRYLDLNTLALRAVRPGGLVASFSCSGPLQEAGFVGMLFQAARRAERGVRLLTQLGAAPDHPQRPGFARSRYLKGALLAVDERPSRG